MGLPLPRPHPGTTANGEGRGHVIPAVARPGIEQQWVDDCRMVVRAGWCVPTYDAGHHRGRVLLAGIGGCLRYPHSCSSPKDGCLR
jgi:hypothetical protein